MFMSRNKTSTSRTISVIEQNSEGGELNEDTLWKALTKCRHRRSTWMFSSPHPGQLEFSARFHSQVGPEGLSWALLVFLPASEDVCFLSSWPFPFVISFPSPCLIISLGKDNLWVDYYRTNNGKCHNLSRLTLPIIWMIWKPPKIPQQHDWYENRQRYLNNTLVDPCSHHSITTNRGYALSSLL